MNILNSRTTYSLVFGLELDGALYMCLSLFQKSHSERESAIATAVRPLDLPSLFSSNTATKDTSMFSSNAQSRGTHFNISFNRIGCNIIAHLPWWY